MENAKRSSIISNTRITLYASFGMFVSFIGFSIYFTIGKPSQIAEYVSIFLSIVFLVFGSRSKSLGLVSLAWVLVGISFVFPFVYSSYANYLTVIISVLLLLVSYELARFNFEMRPIIQSVRVLHFESLDQLQKTTRNHSMVLIQVVVTTLLLSLVVGYLLPGLIAINPPELGVTIFASIALLLITCVLFLVKN
jgi:hypothetical protein